MAQIVSARVQTLRFMEQVLLLALLAEGRSDTRLFSATDIDILFDALALPRPGKTSNILSSLGTRGSMAKPKGTRGVWRVTPQGKAEALGLIEDMDLKALEAELGDGARSVFGSVTQSLLPPWMAPAETVDALRGFLEEFPFEQNVFGMTRFPGGDDPVKPALEACRKACEAHGLTFHLASDRLIMDDLWANVQAHMWGSRYGIGLFEDTVERGMNYNLNIEVGAMITLGRRVALLKDSSIPSMPTDLVGRVYKDVTLSQSKTVETQVHEWIKLDLGLGACTQC